MKKNNVIAVCAVLFVTFAVFSSCASMGKNAVFEDITGKEWALSEVRSAGKTVNIDRAKLAADDMAGYFAVSFSGGSVSGVGAPNRYTGPYTAGENNALTIGTLAGTKMMAFKEPDGLNENEYFAYLARVSRWQLARGKLELYSATASGSEAVLVYTVK